MVPFVGADGRVAVAYIRKEQSSDASLAWMDGAGKVAPIAGTPGHYLSVRLSPDGRRVAAIVVTENQARDLWVYDLDRGTRLRLTSANNAPIYEDRPAWTPDGRRIAFTAPSAGMRSIPSDGSGAPETLLELENLRVTPLQWSPDGTALVFLTVERGRAYGARDRNIGVLVR